MTQRQVQGGLNLSRLASRRADSPRCEVCDRDMWWHGGTEGWGCPDTHGGSPECRSTLYRPKEPGRLPHRPEERWPELYEEEPRS